MDKDKLRELFDEVLRRYYNSESNLLIEYNNYYEELEVLKSRIDVYNNRFEKLMEGEE